MQSSDVIQLVMVILTIGSVGCDVTRELLKAPFDATTVVSDGTTQATGEITQPSKEFTSTTTLGPLYENELMLRAVITYNFDNLQHDSAQDRGEYLTSMVALADIPLAHHGPLFVGAAAAIPTALFFRECSIGILTAFNGHHGDATPYRIDSIDGGA